MEVFAFMRSHRAAAGRCLHKLVSATPSLSLMAQNTLGVKRENQPRLGLFLLLYVMLRTVRKSIKVHA